ncbi:MAG: hypothetical protein CL891_02735 [Dehalococcoidia bacterium]|nr:hypothetical protein [Dehalococcoidia bacterium]
MIDFKIISSDSHVVEPPGLWLERMDSKKWGNRIPRVEAGQPFDQWIVDGHEFGTIGTSSSAGLRYTKPDDITLDGSFKDVPPGGYNPHAHVKDLAYDGVDQDLLYASVATTMYGIQDQDFVQDLFEVYNSWLSDFCSEYPDTLNGIGLVLIDDQIEKGIHQMERASELGLKGVMIPVAPRPHETYDNPMYDKFWAAAQEIGMPLSLHIGTLRPGNMRLMEDGKVTQTAVERCNNEYAVRYSLGHLILSGVFERFPDLRVVNVEHELSWLPFFMHRMDVTYIERTEQASYRYKENMTPSDYMKRNVYHSFQEDGPGIRLRDIIGVNNIMWGNDYPHAESTFPESQRILSEILADVPEEEQSLIVSGNCKRLYNLI